MPPPADLNHEAWIERNIERVPETGCWLWMGSLNQAGYGSIGRPSVGEKGAHRISYRVFNGPILDGHNVLHRCDVRCCVSPHHLYTGTQKENIAYAMRNGGWQRKNPPRGERCSFAKLTEDVVRQIYFAEGEGPEIAKKFGVHKATVYNIKKRETWRHLWES